MIHIGLDNIQGLSPNLGKTQSSRGSSELVQMAPQLTKPKPQFPWAMDWREKKFQYDVCIKQIFLSDIRNSTKIHNFIIF